jgi:hypothetical protein
MGGAELGSERKQEQVEEQFPEPEARLQVCQRRVRVDGMSVDVPSGLYRKMNTRMGEPISIVLTVHGSGAVDTGPNLSSLDNTNQKAEVNLPNTVRARLL